MNKEEEIPKKHKEKSPKKERDLDWVAPLMMILLVILLFVLFGFGIYSKEVARQAANEFCESKGYTFDTLKAATILCHEVLEDLEIKPHIYSREIIK